MALKKTIRLPNGLELSYHRIAMLTIETNQRCSILIRSYLNEEGRDYEKAYEAGELDGTPVLPYTNGEYKWTAYDETMTVPKAYEWLKQHPEFEGAEDV